MKAGTVVMLFPDEWHTYAPDPETGWEEWWVGFRGENIDRRVAEGFFSPKTPLLHIGHSAGIVSCYQEIIRSAEEERKGFQQLTGYGIGQFFIISHFRRFITQQVEETVKAGKICFTGFP